MPYVGPGLGPAERVPLLRVQLRCLPGRAGPARPLAEWIVDGRPEWDLWSLDPRRYGAYADQRYVVDRAVKEVYQQRVRGPLPGARNGRKAARG